MGCPVHTTADGYCLLFCIWSPKRVLLDFYTSTEIGIQCYSKTSKCSKRQYLWASIRKTTHVLKNPAELELFELFSWLQCLALNQHFKGHSSQWHTVAGKVRSAFFSRLCLALQQVAYIQHLSLSFFCRTLLILGYCSLSGEKLAMSVNKLFKMKNRLGSIENNLLPPSAFLFHFFLLFTS